jgi:transcriptional regulator with XRE-family HTH domain
MVGVAKKRERLRDQVRRAVDASGRSRYAICKALGLAEATMSRFMNGRGGLSMDSLDALADLLGLNITVGKPTRTKKGPTRGQHQ